jgi:hypothetical protein
MHVFSGLCKGRLRFPPVFTGLAARLLYGTRRVAVRRHPATGGGEDLVPAASKPRAGPSGRRPAASRAPRRAWFLTWRTSAPVRAQGCATAQPGA